MKNQQEIKFENTLQRMFISPYFEYSNIPNSVGQIIHYLYSYSFRDYDRVQVGNNTVQYRGEEIASFKLVKSIPVFTFIPKYDYLQETQNNYLEMVYTDYGKQYIKLLMNLKNSYYGIQR